MLFRARVEDGRHARGPYVLLDSAVFGLSGVSLLHNLILYFFLKASEFCRARERIVNWFNSF